MEDTDWETAVAPGQCRQLRVLGISAPFCLGYVVLGEHWAQGSTQGNQLDYFILSWFFLKPGSVAVEPCWSDKIEMKLRRSLMRPDSVGSSMHDRLGWFQISYALFSTAWGWSWDASRSNTTRVGCSKQQGIHSCFLTYSSHLSKTGKVALRFILMSKRALSDIFRRCATRFSPRRSCSTYRGESCGCRFQVPTVAFVDVSNADVSCRLFLLFQIKSDQQTISQSLRYGVKQHEVFRHKT